MAAPKDKRKITAPMKNGRRTAPKRPGNKNNGAKRGFPYLAVVIAMLLTGILSYFMFAVDKPEPIKTTKKTAVKNEEALPEKPQPKWQYEKSLPNKEVEVDIPKELENLKPYQMQCGSFRKEEEAESLKVQIAFQGLNSIVKKTGTWYRVILGPYDRKRSAEKDRHKLQRAKINGCQIWYWR